MKRVTIVTLLAACAGLGLGGCKSTGSGDTMETSVSGSSSGSMTSGSTGAAGANPTSGTTGGTDATAGKVQGASAATTGERR
ncbi:MAG: hypothetical protein JWP72_2402 [Massilia sp.]|nr:hypothetical protein [Massilia sp.]MDB5792881.1 hypothetical protein [Massilia sp.]